jgi:hypothetical protein
MTKPKKRPLPNDAVEFAGLMLEAGGMQFTVKGDYITMEARDLARLVIELQEQIRALQEAREHLSNTEPAVGLADFLDNQTGSFAERFPVTDGLKAFADKHREEQQSAVTQIVDLLRRATIVPPPSPPDPKSAN